jgi:RNA polymerase primary sigma factor
LQLVGKLSQVQSDFEMENGRQPTNEEAAERLGVSASKVETLKRSGSGSVSLDQEFSDRDGDGNGALSEVTADPSVSEPAEEADDMLRSRSLRDVLNTLETRERDVLVLRYGLDDGRPRTLYNIGKRFAVTRERVRQIERNALRKLKSPSRSRTLTDHARWAGISPSDIRAATSVPPVDDF